MSLSEMTGLARLETNKTSVSAGRILDLAIATTGLVVFSPIMLVIALAIWIESGGPVLFPQLRLGQRGRQFCIYKFRKFHRTISGTGPTIKNDSRLTQVGRFIEITKLNELPQLWNVLKGDMSIVGPRPETLDFADCFTPAYARVLDHKPGVFGPCQVLFRDEGSLYPKDVDSNRFYREVLFPVKAGIDLAYFSKRTFVSDITWIVRGVFAVIGWRSAPGSVSELTILGRPPFSQS